MTLCKENGYPCFNFQSPEPSKHVMEQVADLKLFHVWKALEAGRYIKSASLCTMLDYSAM